MTIRTTPLPPISEDVAARFWAKVTIGGDDECWLWTAYCKPSGYGQFGYSDRVHQAHRVAYAIRHGDVGPGMLLLHTCDNPPCVNPGHLYPGTHEDNVRDMVTRGRNFTPRGILSGMAKLTDDDVAAIRAAHASGESCKSIARRIGIHATYVGRLVRQVRRPIIEGVIQ